MNDNDRFQELIAKHYDTDLTSDERAELESILNDSGEARRIFARAAAMHVDMTREVGAEFPKLIAPKVRFRFKWGTCIAAAAVLFILAGWIVNMIFMDQAQPFVALRNGEKAEALETPLRDRQCLARKGAEFALNSGITIKVLSPSVFILQGKNADGREQLDLSAGHLRITVNGKSAGISVLTSAGVLKDIGTEFEIQAGYTGKEDVMLKQLRTKNIRQLVTALVLVGLVEFQPAAEGAEPMKLTPDMGKVALSADASLGRVIDREGNASIKPFMGQRWSVADEGMLLEHKDWIKTGRRGANALTLRLKTGVQMILGPDTLIELRDASEIGLIRGEMEVKAAEGTNIAVYGPGGAVQNIDGRTAVLRVRDDALTVLKQAPRWLVGYKNNQSTEAMGSLLANIDGREVPLTLGYHKVTVDIRDQIARTEIEESFVNHTRTVLEGVFYFPLPQDASISGFGMWIGNELVHGEIVEKQRAREIYETILREKRDPGLLEWSGGNMFKARVYPISSEKRIKISYTQTLPKVGNTYSYHYSLQSEMLRLHPLRKLAIVVRLNSAEPLELVTCPSHVCRTDSTERSAKLEFEAEEYVPQRDFEVQVRTRPGDDRIVVIPHRRADDGYFMLLVNAPQPEEQPARDLLPEKDPIRLIIMADTSGSVNGTQRKAQLAFIEAMLGSLGEEDRFNLMTFDVAARWFNNTMSLNSAEARQKAVDFAEARYPLGWSDLDAAFASVLERIDRNTIVVFVGDGIITTGDADPQAFCKRLQGMYSGKGSFHAVAPGSTYYESMVLKTIASLGRGSWRALGGADDPARTAFELLKEMTSPAVRDLKIGFTGVDVAAVYPEVLPNLVPGTQQVVIGRYDPARGDAAGTVTVTGSANGKPVTYQADITLAGAEKGNSFIPRLWARRHLDHLLEQGRTPRIKSQIITLSEDFQIITPYTSFLVLESDADRERFAVRKRFRMRDGEEFFAKGRDNANYELARKQMLRARKWRLGLRRTVLRELADMDRHLLPPVQLPWYVFPEGTIIRSGSGARRYGIGAGGSGYISDVCISQPQSSLSPMDFKSGHEWSKRISSTETAAGDDMNGWFSSRNELDRIGDKDFSEEIIEKIEEDEKDMEFLESSERDAKKDLAKEICVNEPFPVSDIGKKRRKDSLYKAKSRLDAYDMPASVFSRSEGRKFAYSYGQACAEKPIYRPAQFNLFPAIPGPRKDTPPPKWPADVLDLLGKLDRRNAISTADNAFEIQVDSTSIDRRGKTIFRGVRKLSATAGTWLDVSCHAQGGNYTVNWLSGKERGILQAAWLLGSVRPVQEGDKDSWAAPFSWYFGDTVRAYSTWQAELKREEPDRAAITLTAPNANATRLILRIDTARSVLLEARTVYSDTNHSTVTFSDFRKIAGLFWPARITTADKDGKVSGTSSITIRSLPAETLIRKVAAEVKQRVRNAIVLGPQQQSLTHAQQAVKDNKATFEDRWLLLNHFLVTKQQPIHTLEHFEAMEKMMKGRWGLNRIRIALFQQIRRREEHKKLVTALAALLVARPRDAEHAIALDLIGFAGSFTQANERKALLDTIKPVFARQQQIFEPMLYWERQMQYALQSMGRLDQVLAWKKMLAAAYPAHYELQTAYAAALGNQGRAEQAIAFLTRVRKENGPWLDHEIQQFNHCTISILWQSYQLDKVIDFIEETMTASPGHVTAYDWNRYLSALIMLDREAKASRLITDWLTAARAGKLPDIPQRKFQAAMQHALGSGHSLYYNRFDESRAGVLAELALDIADNDEQYLLAAQIITNWKFKQTAQAGQLLESLFARLCKQADTMSVLRLQQYFTWLKGMAFQPEAGADAWNEPVEAVYKRWERTEKTGDKAILGQIITSYGARELQLKYRRKVYSQAGEGTERIQAAAGLFAALQQEPWSEDILNEMLSLLPVLAENVSVTDVPDKAQARISGSVAVSRFMQLTDWMVRTRADAERAKVPGLNEMPRRKLREVYTNALRTSRLNAITYLSRWERDIQPASLRTWAALERIYYQIKAGHNTETAADQLLGLILPVIKDTDGMKQEKLSPLSCLLAARVIAALTYLQTTEHAERSLTPGILELIDKAIRSNNPLLDWKLVKYRLLIALDRGDDLEKCLRKWYGQNKEIAKLRWGRHLAQIYAERNRIDSAVGVFLELDRLNALSRSDYRVLADWYTVLDARNRVREFKIKSWLEINEWQIQQWLYNVCSHFERRGEEVPEEMDPEVPIALSALLRKTVYPGNHVYVIRRLYSSTRDFRILECMSEAVIGHTSQYIYSFLQNLRQVTDLMQEEAALDRLKAHLLALHSKSKNAVDCRALRLLEFMSEYRAATQSNGAGPHVKAALRAMTEAFKGEWEDGEPVLMASFLASVGALSPDTLFQEQTRELGVLCKMAKPGTLPHLQISGYYAQVLWAGSRRNHAVRVLEGTVNAYRAANNGLLPQTANTYLSTLSSYYAGLSNYLKAERMWFSELKMDHPQQQIHFLKTSLYQLYYQCISGRGETALGRGERLYRAVHAGLIAELDQRTDENTACSLVSTMCSIWSYCHTNLKYSMVPGDIRKFAFGRLPRVLDMYNCRNCQNSISIVADRLKEICGYLTAIEFLVTRAENEPSWLRLQNADFWRYHSYRLARWRSELKQQMTPELQERLLAIVLRELREDLRSMSSSSRDMYWCHCSYYWREKEDDFVRTAGEVLRTYADSEARVRYIATYLHDGLDKYGLAIDALYAAYRKAILSIDGRHQLCRYLHISKRWKESIPILSKMITDRPDSLEYRVMLIRAGFYTKDIALRDRVLKEADAFFHENGRWTEGAIAQLGAVCLETHLFEKSVQYYREAIALHVKTHPDRGVGNGTLSQYYRQISSAYISLGRTDDAVDAAAGAIIAWGRSRENRRRALQQLENVLAGAGDLDEYIIRFSDEVRKTGQENPILRKALGNVLFRKRDYDRAAEHLREAARAQPNDLEIHRRLIETYDRMKQPKAATAQLLDALKLSGHDISLYKDLGRRYLRQERTADAERAYTGMVEMLPNESESHQALAEVREQEKRWQEAELQWRQVIRIRTKEPTGFLGLARVLIKQNKAGKARKELNHIINTNWPQRFDDIKNKAKTLLRTLNR